ncbi:hypothetical protein D1007_08639 [Hordeum vulgare]|nr:hypothetical protein D1007_08639 [Hordeum vulgare]
MRHHVLVYHYCLATRPCERFAKCLNSLDYMFAMVDTTNDLTILNTLGSSYHKLLNIQGQYTVLGGEKKKQKDSLVDLDEAIIDPYYTYMKAECDKDKSVWHKAWVNELDEEHIKYAAKDAHTNYKMYMRIGDTRNCRFPEDDKG